MMNEIVVKVSGGLVVDVSGIPPDTIVRVEDYDCDMDAKGAELNADDEPHVPTYWASK